MKAVKFCAGFFNWHSPVAPCTNSLLLDGNEDCKNPLKVQIFRSKT